MIRFFTLLLGLLATPAFAQSDYETGYFNVTGVAPDDTLNIRAEADGVAEVIGELAYNTVNVEVVARDGNWAMIASGEQAGWVSFTYLERSEPAMLESGIPAGLMCGGTEPFWRAEISETEMNFNAFWLEEDSISYPIIAAPRARGTFYPVFLMLEGNGVAMLEPRLCSDGMSDIPYGWSLHIVRPGQSYAAYEGCCTLRRK